MNKIEDKLELLQKQIESTTSPMIRTNLFLKKIELLKLQKSNKIDYKKMIKQLEIDIKKGKTLKFTLEELAANPKKLFQEE